MNMNNHGNNNSVELVRIKIRSVTGAEFELEVDRDDSIATIKEAIGNSLSIPSTDFTLVHNYKQLSCGTLATNDMTNGSKVLIVPVIKSGYVHRRDIKSINTVHIIQYITDKTMQDFLTAKTYLGFNVRSGSSVFHVRLKFERPRFASNNDNDDDDDNNNEPDNDETVTIALRANCKKRKRQRKTDRPRKSPRTTTTDARRQALIDFRGRLRSDYNLTIADNCTIKVYVRLENAGELQSTGTEHAIDLRTILNTLQELLAKRVLNENGEIVEQFETFATNAAKATCAGSSGNDAALLQEQVTFDKMRTLLTALKKKKAARKKPEATESIGNDDAMEYSEDL